MSATWRKGPDANQAPSKSNEDISSVALCPHYGKCPLDTAMERLLEGWKPQALHYLRRVRSSGGWAVLRVCDGRRTWTPVPSRSAGLELIQSGGVA